MRIFFKFFGKYRWQTAFMLVCLLLGGIMEGIGLSMLIPLLAIALPDQGMAHARRAHISNLEQAVAEFFAPDAYQAFVDRTGLRERILMELHRKDFKQMRWEEIWDCATRIRNLFLHKTLPGDLEAALRRSVTERFAEKAVVVRSSAPEEDAAGSSFAGLHASYVNIRGEEAVVEHIRLVWASLWSDAALLYRQELGLDAGRSAMAVVVQERVGGQASGICFTQSPTQPSQALVEAVYGLNQGLVDGDGSITARRL